MSADPFAHRRRSDQHRNRMRGFPHEHSRARSGWIVNAHMFPGTSGRAVQGQSVHDFVHSEDARQALKAFDERLATSISDTYREAARHYIRWENSVLRRKLHEAEQERAKLEQDNEDLKKALLATRQLAPQDIRAEFNELAEQWRDETGHMSSAISFTQHPAYLRIIAMGPAVVPFILEDLARTHSHWFVALRLITGENPVKLDDKGSVQRITDAWITWGRERGLV